MGDLGGGDEILSGVLACAATPIALVGAGGRLLRCNPAFERLLGYAANELREKTVQDITHPDDVAADEALFAELRTGTRASYQLEKRYCHKDGSVVWGRLTVSLVPGREVAIGMVEDISEMRSARGESARLLAVLGERVKELQALHRTAKLLSRIELSLPTLLAEIAALLPPAFQWPERAAGRIWFDTIDRTTAGFDPAAELLAGRFTACGASGAIEVMYRDPSGLPEPLFLSEEQALLDSMAEMLSRELDRRDTEDRLRRSRERLSLALSAAEMGVWELDVGASRVTWSAEAARFIGHDGELCHRFGESDHTVHPEDRARLYRTLGEAAQAQRQRFDVDFRLARPEGGYRRIAAAGQVVGEGEARRVLAVLADVTLRRNLEDSLRQSQKMEALGLLASSVAHDFNNLLAIVTGNAAALRQELRAEDPLYEIVVDIDEAAKRGTSLVKQLLAFSRKSPYEPRALDLCGMVAKLEPLLRRLLGKAISLETLLDPTAGRVWADLTQLEQIVLNLVVNARDAMTAGGVVTVTVAHAGSGLLALKVADTGHGIPPEIMARIFEPFFTTKGPEQGTGLGLAVVFGAVKQCEGQILVDSEPGRGTTFQVLLPQHRS